MLTVGLDPTFGSAAGWVANDIGFADDQAQALALQPDGKIVVAGVANVGGTRDFAIARYNADGSLDTSFDGDGIKTMGLATNWTRVGGVVVQPDGKIVVGGTLSIAGVPQFAAFRLNADDGSLDDGSAGDSTPSDSFATAGIFTTTFGANQQEGQSLAVQPAGESWNLIIAGYVKNGPNYDTAMLRLNADGALDSTFGVGGKVAISLASGDDSVTDVDVQGDKILVAGDANADWFVARFNANGSLDTGFGTAGKTTSDFFGGEDALRAFTIQPDGKIVAAGSTVNGAVNHWALARYSADGLPDATFGVGGKIAVATAGTQPAWAVSLQADGKILAAGGLSNGSNHDFAVMRFTPNGALDLGFAGDGSLTTSLGPGQDIAYASVLQPDGRLLLAGSSSNGSNLDFTIARYVLNSAPVASAGGPYTIGVNADLVLDASASSDPEGDSLTYLWDLDNDGQFDDAEGVAPTISATTLAALGLGPGTHVISVVAQDPFGLTSVATSTFATNDFAVGINPPAVVRYGIAGAYTFSALYASAANQNGQFTYVIDWGDGQTQSLTGGLQIQAFHTFNTVGATTINVSAIGQDGAVSTSSQVTVSVNFAYRNGANLIWHGSGGGSQVQFEQLDATTVRVTTPTYLGNHVEIYTGITGKVIANNGGILDARGLQSISAELSGTPRSDSAGSIIYGGGGNDVIVGGYSGGEGGYNGRPNVIFGGGGNDLIYGTQGPDGGEAETNSNLIVGGDGDDTIYSDYASDGGEGGHTGRNVIVGGAGSDTIVARLNGFDQASYPTGSLIVSGDADIDLAALETIFAEWNSNRSYAERTANIAGTGVGERLNGNNFLVLGSTVFNDNSVDTLFGTGLFGTGVGPACWYFYDFIDDVLNGDRVGEKKTSLRP